jgi:phosphomannomutase/phosphoglucomutase
MKVDPTIFKSYDIRGINDEQLSPELANAVGKGFGTYLLRKGTKDCLVCRDTRVTSEEYQTQLMDGLMSTGINVYDMGLALSSHMYHARHYYNIDGGVMVTASHNPKNYNGFKLCSGINAIVTEEIQKLKKIIEEDDYLEGRGKHYDKSEANKIYYDEIKKRVLFKKPLKVVVDAGHQTPALFIPDFLRSLGCEVIVLHEKIDSSFPAGVPDPVNLEFMKATQEAVIKNNADVGIVMDADGDRGGAVDDKGRIWMGDMILDLLVRDYLPKRKGAKVIVEVKDSEIVVEDTKRLGGIPIFWKTGHALLDLKVYEEKALLCGEMSCHYWVTDNWYVFDDTPYALTQVLRIISESDKKFSELMDEIPKYPSTPEIRFKCPEDKKIQVVQEGVDHFRNLCDKVVDVDGIRGYKHNGWFLLRKSNTQPLLSVRAEAKTNEDLEELKTFVKEFLDKFDFIDFDWNRQYEEA